MQSLTQQMLRACSLLGIVQCDRKKIGRVPWSLPFIDGANISHCPERVGSDKLKVYSVYCQADKTFCT